MTDLEGLEHHACSSGTDTPPKVREQILIACREIRELREKLGILENEPPNLTTHTQVFYDTAWRQLDPAAPPWEQLREDERERWERFVGFVFQRAVEQVGVPVLANGAGRIVYTSTGELVAVVTEEMPLTVMAVDNGLALWIPTPSGPIGKDGSHPTFTKISARRIEPATYSLEEANGLPMPPMPSGVA